jgi:hypothetical protein
MARPLTAEFSGPARLCGDDVPDLERITACMKRNRANLSSACGAAMGAGATIIRGVTDPNRRP